ncbi:MAG: hypothetical protein AB7D51_15020 [Desulfovibrionaceae bacterium]
MNGPRSTRIGPTALLIIGLVALNVALGQAVARAGLPLYLDTTGTVLAGVLLGPWLGAACGGLTLLAWELLVPGMWYWAPVGMIIGLMAAVCARLRLFISPSFAVLSGFLMALPSAVLSALIRFMAEDPAITGEGVVSSLLIHAGRDATTAVLSSSFLVELVDKVSVCLLAYAALKLLAPRLPAPAGERGRAALAGRPGLLHPPTLAVVGGTLALLFLYATFFVTEVFSPEPLGYDAAAYTAFQNIGSPTLRLACELLAQWGGWAALGGVAIMLWGLYTQD